MEKKNPPFAETIVSEAMLISQGEGQMCGQSGARPKKSIVGLAGMLEANLSPAGLEEPAWIGRRF
jgi:hypothetical protein